MFKRDRILLMLCAGLLGFEVYAAIAWYMAPMIRCACPCP